MNAQTNSESIENIMELADDYAIERQRQPNGIYAKQTENTREALRAAVEELAKDAEAYRTICKRFDVKVDSPVKGQS